MTFNTINTAYIYIFDENMRRNSFPAQVKTTYVLLNSGMTNSAPEWKRNNNKKNTEKKEAIYFYFYLDS